MIKATELRIGNCILYGGDMCLVDGLQYQPDAPESRWRITFRTIDTNNPTGHGLRSGKFENWIDPIPLTPEILGKCGFGPDSNGWKLKISETMFLWWGEMERTMRMCSSEADWSYPIYLKEPIYRFQYLHQLQNLFFALTGADLNYPL